MKRTRIPTLERRFVDFSHEVELRTETAEDGAERLGFRGHAAVFNRETDLFLFREKVAEGAFAKTIKDGADVRFLFNHNPDSVMARTTNGTLKLSEDAEGLLTEADLDPEDIDVQRLAPKLRSGNVSQMSFGFRVVKEKLEDEDSDKPLRIIREAQLFDVSSVTFPAYEDANGELQAATDMVKRYAESMGLPLFESEPRMSTLQLLEAIPQISSDEEELDPEKIRSAIDALGALVPAGAPEAPLTLDVAARRLALARRRAAVA